MDSKGKTSSLPSTLTKSSISYQFKSRLTSPRLIHSRSPPSLSNPSIQISQPIKIGRQPIECYCPCCRQNIVTDTESVPGFLTCLMAGLFCATGLWCCCCIPCCIDSCKDIEHRCPDCQFVFGKKKRVGK
ncbi:MyD88 [Sarcoptes scabiei]|nr:MyD88 [Sarcoptes scabiei]